MIGTEYEAEVARRVPSTTTRGDSLAVIMRIPLAIGADPALPRDGDAAAASFELQDGDRVFIRQLPGYSPIVTVHVEGEVLFPGHYPLERRSQTITSVIQRAGGLVPQAYIPEFRLVRAGKPVAVKSTARPGATWRRIRPGARGGRHPSDPAVRSHRARHRRGRIRGACAVPARTFARRLSAQGRRVTEGGDRSRVAVTYASGAIETARGTPFGRCDPAVQPGATIVVPVRGEETGFDWDNFLSKTLAVLSTLATLSIAAAQFR